MMKPLTLKFDIPINFTVVGPSEVEAEQRLFKFLNHAIKEYMMEYEIPDYELFEFIPASACDGRGNYNTLEGQPIQPQEQTVHGCCGGSGKCC